MRDLHKDLKELETSREYSDLPDEYLEKEGLDTRVEFPEVCQEMKYGITFVESTVAKEWLERAINAENNGISINSINNDINSLIENVVNKYKLIEGVKYKMTPKGKLFYNRPVSIFLKEVRFSYDFSYNNRASIQYIYIEGYEIKKDGTPSKVKDGMCYEDIENIIRL